MTPASPTESSCPPPWRAAPAAEAGRAPPLAPCDIHIWHIKLNRAALAEADLHLLSADEALRAGRLHRPEDQARFISGRAALRRVLASYVGAEPARLGFRYDSFGKPHLDPAIGGRIAFNVSHSGAAMLVAIGRFPEIGIDLERVHADAYAATVAAQYFSARERCAVERAAPQERPFLFLSLWTRKEAVMKAVGRGLSFPLERIDTAPPPGAVETPADWHGPCHVERWRVWSLDILPGYACALAIAAAAGEPTLVLYTDGE